MELLIISSKIILALLTVYLSIRLGERINLKYTGLITSFPTVVALVIFFIGVEQGNLAAGIAAFQISYAIVLFNLWMLFYLIFLRLGPIIASFISLILYFFSALIFHNLFEIIPALPYGYIIYLGVFLFGFYIFRNLKEIRLNKIKENKNLKNVMYVLVPLIVILLTYVSNRVGPIWAGIFISAPSTALLTLFYFHKNYGKDVVMKTLESFYLYTGTFVLFGLTVYLLIKFYDSLALSFIVAILVTIIYAYFINIKLIPSILNKMGSNDD